MSTAQIPNSPAQETPATDYLEEGCPEVAAKPVARFYELDLLRFCAAMSVVLFHYAFRGYAADSMSILEFPRLGQVFRYGYLGVELFFMISGFVILLSAQRKDSIGFATARFTRLYPTFWAAVSLTAIVTVLLGGDLYQVGLTQYLVNLTMVSNLFGIEYVDGVYWTLWVELKFYFWIFLILAFRRLDRVQVILGGWAVASVLLAALGTPNVARSLLMPEWSSYFVAGAIFFLIRTEGASASRILLVAVAYALSIHYSMLRMAEYASIYHTEFSAVVVVCVITSFYGIFALMASEKLTWINRRQMMFLGVLTYPLYLIHQNVGFMIFNAYGTEVNKHVLLVVTIGLMCAVSYAIHQYCEKPLAGLLKRQFASMKESISLSK